VPARSFLCLRHGVTEWNQQGLFQGRTDIPLNDEGVSQAREAALHLRNLRLDHIVASPLRRAVQTAEIVSAACSSRLPSTMISSNAISAALRDVLSPKL